MGANVLKRNKNRMIAVLLKLSRINELNVTRVKVWDNEMLWEYEPQFFFPAFSLMHECFHNSIETQRTCFLFLLENTATNKNEKNLLTLIIKHQLSLLAPSLRQLFLPVLSLSSYQREYFLRAGCFISEDIYPKQGEYY